MNELTKVKVRYAITALIIGFLAGWVFITMLSPGKAGNESETIKFAFLGGMTGDIAVYGVPMSDAVKLAIEEINSKGGIKGKNIELLIEDGKCAGKDAATAIQKLINVDKVNAVIGGLCSAETLAAAPIAEAAEMVMLSPSSTNPTIKNAGDFIFRNVPSDAGQGVEAATFMNEKGYKKIGVLSRNDEWGVALAEVFVNKAEELGIEIVAHEKVEPSATDAKTQITKIKNANPDAVYLPVFVAEGIIVLKQMKELGLNVPKVSADAVKDDSLTRDAGQAAEGLIFLLPGIPESPEFKAFAAAYKAKYGKEYAAYTSESYDAVKILAWACGNSDCSGKGIKEALYSMPEYKGASGTYAFDEFGEVMKGYDFFEVKNGEIVPFER